VQTTADGSKVGGDQDAGDGTSFLLKMDGIDEVGRWLVVGVPCLRTSGTEHKADRDRL
jgi:hypothetical protein